MTYQHIKVPEQGEKISFNPDGSLNVPSKPIISYIQGDGVGEDITPVMLKVVDAAVEKAYGSQKQIQWMEVFNGEKAAQMYDGDWFPQETLTAVREHIVAIKGPLTTPIGGGFRSLNVALAPGNGSVCKHAPGEVDPWGALASQAARKNRYGSVQG